MAFSMVLRRALPAPFALAFLLPAVIAPSAHEADTYTIAAAPGYGVEDCLGEGGECGHAVADAWCEAQGRGAAVKFGRSQGDVTAGGSRPYFITCGD